MHWHLAITWTVIISTFSECCNQTCPCSCVCVNSTTVNISTNETTSKAITPTATTNTAKTTSSLVITTPSSVTISKAVSTAASSTILSQTNRSHTSNVITTPKTRFEYNITGYVGQEVTFNFSGSFWSYIEWFRYSSPGWLYSSEPICTVTNSYHHTFPRGTLCFDCNMTKFVIYDLTLNDSGKYVVKRTRHDNQYEEACYNLTVIYANTTAIVTNRTCDRRQTKNTDTTNHGIGKHIIETIKKANIPLGIHAVWAGIVVSVALIALYMGNRRRPRKPRYTRLSKYDPDEFWTKT
ncbi:membrane protein RL13 [Human betaherpesvirus 5]|nr:membrane protein RL13 [Human betaherpesvirus 5]